MHTNEMANLCIEMNINFIFLFSFVFHSFPENVQVHTRITYLRHLIVSLAQAKDISKTLLIFSHDYYDEDINDLVQTIDFCKVLQVSKYVVLPFIVADAVVSGKLTRNCIQLFHL